MLAPTICAFTVGKGAWLQHRAQTLALWCMFAQTFPVFQDASSFLVHSRSSKAIAEAAIREGMLSPDGYTVLTGTGIQTVAGASPDTTLLFVMSLLALLANIGVFVYMIYRMYKTKKNPYTGELYTDHKKYQEIKALAE